MTETVYPPAWVDTLLRTMLPLKHRDNVSGDLHDAHTMAMIRASGGVDEIFVLPFLMIVPGAVCAAIGALGSKAAAHLIGSHPLQQR